MPVTPPPRPALVPPAPWSAPAPARTRDLARAALDAAGVALVLVAVGVFALSSLGLQWDLRAYRYAARAAAAGLDPYAVASLEAVAGRPWSLPWLYPPVALGPFAALATLPWPAAAAAWMALKLAALVALVAVWRRAFLRGVESLVLALVVAFGFDGTVLWDLRAGNVAILEALLLWSGLAAFAAGRRGPFAAFVVTAALFKLWPVAFLALLLVPRRDGRADGTLLAGALAAFAVLVAGPFLAPPAAGWSGFAAIAASPRPTSAECPGALALLDALAGRVLPGAAAGVAALGLWAGWLALLAWLAARWLAPGWRQRDPRDWAMAAALLYVLAVPRPMAYGYVMAIAPALWLAPIPFAGRAGRLLLAAVLSAHGLARLAHHPPQGLLHEQAPFLLLLGLWGLDLAWSGWARRGPARA